MDEMNQTPMQDMNGNMPQQPQGGNGLSVAAMVLGIVGVICSCCFYYLAIPCGLASLILSIISLKGKKPGRGMAIAGLVLGIIALVFGIIDIALAASSDSILEWAKSYTEK